MTTTDELTVTCTAEGVPVAQGFLLHRPMPAAEVEALLRRPTRG